MNDHNVYAPPETDIRQSAPDAAGSGPLGQLSTKEIKKLYNHSRSIGALVFLWGLFSGLIALSVIAVMAGSTASSVRNNRIPVDILIGTSVVGLALLISGVVGCWTRQSWGRVVGIILCLLMLFHFPFGTLIGAFGLFALTKGRRLFGPNRLTHQQLKEAVTYRKANDLR